MKNRYLLFLTAFGMLQLCAMNNNNFNGINNQMMIFGLKISQSDELTQEAKNRINELNQIDKEEWPIVDPGKEDNLLKQATLKQYKKEGCQAVKNIFPCISEIIIPAKLLNQFFLRDDFGSYCSILRVVDKKIKDKYICNDLMNSLPMLIKKGYILIPIINALNNIYQTDRHMFLMFREHNLLDTSCPKNFRRKKALMYNKYIQCIQDLQRIYLEKNH